MFQKTLAKQMQPFLLVSALPMVIVSFISCTGFDKFSASFAQKKPKESAPQVQDARVLKDDNGTVTAALSASNRGSSQRVTASSKSAIAGASVVFPPGSLAIETDVEVTLGPAPTLVVEGATEIATAGPAVAIAANGGLELGVDFEMQIPLPAGQASLLGDSSQSYAVLFEYVAPSTKSKVTGRLQAGEFETDIAFAKFKFRYFGTFQVVKLADPGTNVEKQTASSSNQNVTTNNQNSGNTNTTGSSTGNGSVADTTSPTAGAWQSVSGVSETGFTLNWSAAVDDRTTSANLEYQICTSNRGSDIATAAQCASATGANVALSWTKGITNATRTGLNPNTTYFYNLVVRDEAQNLVVYGTQSAQTASNSAPTPGSYLPSTNIAATSLTINWTSATDTVTPAENLSYLVCQSTDPAVVSTVSGCAAATAVPLDWSLNVNTVNVAGLLPGHTYSFRVLVKDSQGLISPYAIKTETMPILVPTVSPRYVVAGKWMDYASITDGTFCTDHSDPDACVHGGERKVAVLAGVTSCSGLTAEDNLGAFDWECIMDGPNASIRSMGLKTGKRLSDLLNSTPGWRQLQLTVRSPENIVMAQSALTTWWSNSVTALTPGGNSFNSGSIYVATSDVIRTSAITLANSRIGIVTLNSSTIRAGSYSANCDGSSNKCLFKITGVSLANPNVGIWIEGRLDTDFTTVYGIYAKFAVRLRIDNTKVRGFTHGLKVFQSKLASITDSAAMFMDQNCLILDNTGASIADSNAYHSVRNFQATDCGYHGVYLNNVHYNRFVRLRLNSNNASQAVYSGALEISDSLHNTFVDVLAANNKWNGVTINGTSQYNIFLNSTLANNGGSGFAVTPLSHLTQMLISTVAVNNVAEGLASAGSGLALHGVAVGMNGVTKQIDAIGANLTGTRLFHTASSCGNDGTTVSNCSSLFSGTDVELNNLFAPSTTTAQYSTLSLGFGFLMDPNYPFEMYGNSMGTYDWTYTANRGECSAECRRWNWSVLSGESIHNVLPDFTATAAFDCPNELLSTVADSVSYFNEKSTATNKPYLRNAVEITTDFIGNNNGLCESNEVCLYARNLGAHQEYASFTKSCKTPTGDSVANAKIYSP